jgi:hypothetical protein
LAKYSFSSLDDDEAVTFDPSNDVLLFDNCFLTPDSVSVLSCAASVVLLAQNRRVRLIGVTVDQLSADNVRFVGYDLRDASPVAVLGEPALLAAAA